MSETQATNWTQSGPEHAYAELAETGEQFGWLDLKVGPLPIPPATTWAAPAGLPIPLPPPHTPAGSDVPALSLDDALTSLPDGWQTLPSEHFGMGGSGFEYIVIGPGGVFTVTATGHPEGHVGIDQHLRNSKFQAERATRLLDQAGLVDIYVEAAIVFLGAEVTLHNSSDVIVARVADIGRTLVSLPTTLTPLQVQSVCNTAERRETWIERVAPKG